MNNLNNKDGSDLNSAVDLCNTAFSHSELINFLQNGNVAQKHIAALKLDSVNNIHDAQVLVNNLIGVDGKIREAVAFKIRMLLSNDDNVKAIFALLPAEFFSKATIDINANICRMVIDAVIYLKKYDSFSQMYADYIYSYAQEALIEYDKFEYSDKKYLKNKQLFKLYWCLEALSYFYEYLSIDNLKSVVAKSIKIREYTIREKAAKILKNSKLLPELLNKLKSDENFYVRYQVML